MKSATITPSKLNGRIEIPSSKSLCHRAIICAALAKGKSTLTNICDSDDIQTTINAVKSMGAEVKNLGNGKYSIDGTNTFAYGKNRLPWLRKHITLFNSTCIKYR